MVSETTTETRLSQLIAEALEECNNDRGLAFAYLNEAIIREPEAYEQRRIALVQRDLRWLLAHHDSHTRTTLIATHSRVGTDASVEAMKAASDLGLYGFPMPGGKLLGETTSSERKEGVKYYRGHSLDAAMKARFLELVDEVCGDKVTSEGITQPHMAQLLRQARREVLGEK